MVLPLIYAAAIGGAAGLSAMGKLLGGAAKKSAAKRRAQTLEMGAQMDLDEAGFNAQLGLEDDERVAGALATQAAAGGGGGLGGSALRVLHDLGRQSLTKARLTVYQGQSAAWARRNEATQTKAAGKNAFAQGALGAGSTLIGAAARVYAGGGGG
jgi:hypothetical protein